MIHKAIRHFNTLNLAPAMKHITLKLKAWEGLPLTLIGRINVFKMILLPKLLYLYRAAPYLLPKIHFESIDRLQTPFLWQNQIPRLSRDTLKASYDYGGLALLIWRYSCLMPNGGSERMQITQQWSWRHRKFGLQGGKISRSISHVTHDGHNSDLETLYQGIWG